MESILDSKSFLPNRLKTFKGTIFDKNRSKCSSKKMAEAGFYSTHPDSDLVKCFACGIEIQNWSKSSDDPWSQHHQQSPDCLYLRLKKSYSNELTVKEFLEIEKYRYLRNNQKQFEERTKNIKMIFEKVDSLGDDEELMLKLDENNEFQVDTVKK